MTVTVRPLIAGNWKMNGLRNALDEIKAICEGLAERKEAGQLLTDALICPPITLLYVATALAEDTPLAIGAQDCHWQSSGAHTGDVAAEMIADCLATHVIVGHSERRSDHGEDDGMVCRKVQAAWRAGLVAIVCIGETEAERRNGTTLDILARQLAGSLPDGAQANNTIIAYEPVWAIGTGLTPSTGDVGEAHAFIRGVLGDRFETEGTAMKILYGGSVKPSNAHELLAVDEVNGALVGGASLKAEDFLAICDTYQDRPS